LSEISVPTTEDEINENIQLH